MNRLLTAFRAGALSTALFSLLFLSGCATTNPEMAAGDGGIASGASNGTNPALETEVQGERFEIRKGDKIKMEFVDAPINPKEWEQVVREDGTITLPMNLVIVAEGRTKRQLAEEIHKIYVPKYYKRMTVNIKADERYYYISGEVRTPGLKPHPGAITLTKAIGAAGDFTDFANRRNIQLTRANGQKLQINWNKAQDDATKDVPIYPGDKILVKRRVIF